MRLRAPGLLAAVFLAVALCPLAPVGAEDDPIAMVDRAQRWIQRLRWELVDTGVSAEVPVDLGARVVAEPERTTAIVAETIRTLTDLRARLEP